MNRKPWQVMFALVGLIKPLLHMVLLAIFFGVLGYLCAIAITVLASYAFLQILGYTIPFSLLTVLTTMLVCAVFRGILRYIEQMSNHYIAFKILAILRHQIFVKLRSLAPAKLEGKDKGNLISVLTSDIELLEVFYAHTISPIVIAFVVSLLMILFIGQFHFSLAIVAFVFYSLVGVVLPIVFGKKGGHVGRSFRNQFGHMNGFILDSLRGIRESMQYHHGDKRLVEMLEITKSMETNQKQLKEIEGTNMATCDSTVLLAGMCMFVSASYLYLQGSLSFVGVLLVTASMVSSMGPVAALSNLSNNLHHTIASGNRVLDILEEEPLLEDVVGQAPATSDTMTLEKICFGYDQEMVVEEVSLQVTRNQIIGIHGKSGSGKSTLLKLMMRFFKVNQGNICFDNRNIETINTIDLRNKEAYVIQETYLFNDTLANNIAIAKIGANIEEIHIAAKKAAIHDFIMSLPSGYDTKVGELGGCLSGGQKQRIGIARAFLHDSDIILLDEPTSNLDSLNEAVILQSLVKEKENKMIVLVSHRQSTMSIVDKEYPMESSRIA